MITKTFSFGTVTINFDTDEITINMMITGEVVKTDIEDTQDKIKHQGIQTMISAFVESEKKV